MFAPLRPLARSKVLRTASTVPPPSSTRQMSNPYGGRRALVHRSRMEKAHRKVGFSYCRTSLGEGFRPQVLVASG